MLKRDNPSRHVPVSDIMLDSARSCQCGLGWLLGSTKLVWRVQDVGLGSGFEQKHLAAKQGKFHYYLSLSNSKDRLCTYENYSMVTKFVTGHVSRHRAFLLHSCLLDLAN